MHSGFFFQTVEIHMVVDFYSNVLDTIYLLYGFNKLYERERATFISLVIGQNIEGKISNLASKIS